MGNARLSVKPLLAKRMQYFTCMCELPYESSAFNWKNLPQNLIYEQQRGSLATARAAGVEPVGEKTLIFRFPPALVVPGDKLRRPASTSVVLLYAS